MSISKRDWTRVEAARLAALEVLNHNAHGPFHGLPRTAGWGYPEPYTRDWMLSAVGILLTGQPRLIDAVRRVLESLAKNQSRLGHIPSLAHDSEDRGASDTTPLFLFALAIYRKTAGKTDFLEKAARRALRWMEYQSPSDRVIVAQLPTSDWRDEQWVLGFGLYVNLIVYAYLRLYGQHKRADYLRHMMARFALDEGPHGRRVHEGLVLKHQPHYAIWSYKIHRSEHFDLLGNSLAILTGLASHTRSRAIVAWLEDQCHQMREKGELGVDLPPNFFPFVKPGDTEWRPRDATYNRPGEYHNGGIWPWVCGFYVAALVATGRYRLAEQRLLHLTDLVEPAREADVSFGFNEWLRARDGKPAGQDWQTWSAALYIYAVECVRQRHTPFFDEIRA
ncbi:amylo-alpha-1,6-glucosidase [Candidatus Neomarinimicrobiota bacterium]